MRCGTVPTAAGRDLHPRTGLRRSGPVRHRGHRRGRPRIGGGRRRCAVLDPEHLEGVHPDARARHERRPAVAESRPRALGQPFNSIVQLERERGVPRNPFINAGAIAVTDEIVASRQPREALGEILRFMQFLAQDSSIAIDKAVAAFGEADRLPQHGAGQLHEVLRRSREPGGFHAGRLLPSLRYRDVVPATRHGGAVSWRMRAAIPRPADRWSRPSERGASMR